jgi:WXG100 family type VII secretion target
MSQAIVNPDELRKFANHLKQFNGELQASSARLNAQFRQLGSTWRDKEHAKFAQEFEQTMKAIQRFKAASDQQIPVLIKKAQIIDQYLRRG